jgi:hypothetical protein
MGGYAVIRSVTETLESLLQQNITSSTDPELHGVGIDLRSPKEMREDNDAKGISLWLYRVVRDGHTLNRPAERPAPNRVERQPLPVNLYYLVTPIASSPDDEQLLLGKVLQLFNDTPVLRGAVLTEELRDSAEELRLTLELLSLEELTRVWDALKEPYQLSVSYLVQLVEIESAREPLEVSPVAVEEAAYSKIVTVT